MRMRCTGGQPSSEVITRDLEVDELRQPIAVEPPGNAAPLRATSQLNATIQQPVFDLLDGGLDDDRRRRALDHSITKTWRRSRVVKRPVHRATAFRTLSGSPAAAVASITLAVS